MKYQKFLGEVQHRIEEDDLSEAVRTTRAVLETLGERVTEGEATDMASPLPMEIDRYLLTGEHGEKYSFEEFIENVMDKLNYDDLVLLSGYAKPGKIDRPEAVFRTKAVFDLLAEQMPGSELEDIRQQLPEDFEDLFDFVKMEDKPWDE